MPRCLEVRPGTMRLVLCVLRTIGPKIYLSPAEGATRGIRDSCFFLEAARASNTWGRLFLACLQMTRLQLFAILVFFFVSSFCCVLDCCYGLELGTVESITETLETETLRKLRVEFLEIPGLGRLDWTEHKSLGLVSEGKKSGMRYKSKKVLRY